LFLRSFRLLVSMENPLVAGVVEKQHEAKPWAWSGETTEGKASPSDCHETAKVVPAKNYL
jgi:hypothetical protein